MTRAKGILEIITQTEKDSYHSTRKKMFGYAERTRVRKKRLGPGQTETFSDKQNGPESEKRLGPNNRTRNQRIFTDQERDKLTLEKEVMCGHSRLTTYMPHALN